MVSRLESRLAATIGGPTSAARVDINVETV